MDWVLDKASRLDIAQLIAIGAIVWFMVRPLKQELKIVETEIRNDIKSQAARTDKLYEMFIQEAARIDQQMKAQSDRTDQLYTMFIDLLKERK